MATKTDTRNQSVFVRTDPSAANNRAIFKLGSDDTRSGMTQITLPEKSTWTPGPHWHESHVERFRVVQGRVLIKLDQITRIVTPADGSIRVERFVIHEFMRADCNAPNEQKDDGEVITEEWTEPADGVKHVFFRNLFSILQDSEKYWRSWTYVQASYVAASHDDYVVVLPGRLSYLATHTLYAAIKILARLSGLQPWIEEYTPDELRNTARGLKIAKTE